MSYLQAIVIALVQGVTELFPISSLGHSVLFPAWFGGSWETMVTQSSQANSASSFYLAYIVALHVATALALLWFFRLDWIRIIRGFFRSVRRSFGDRHVSVIGSDERLAWLIVVATIPVGITGLLLEHTFRTLLAKPIAASIFLFVNGLILLAGERSARRAEAARAPQRGRRAAAAPAGVRGGSRGDVPIAGGSPDLEAEGARQQRGPRSAGELAAAYASDVRISRLPFLDGLFVGVLQISALCAGISRDGITLVGGLWRGLNREDAARFAFLLATPPILAAGVLKLPDLTGHAAAHIHGQVVVGFMITGVTAYLCVRWLLRYFRTGRTLTPFAIYCLVAGVASIIRFA
ncbi:MAG: undecaprenyl-diphosphate phosphatase [Solirubrobacterales bacterium]|nr:undecaprenyl-diphosphate phosphatase [Solirubrobacterales bacterium]MBV9534407.1 undecaprenyl-diphosphate phosphatase [Solirubrobacterales bacterium]